MKNNKLKQFRIIEADNAEEFQNELNNALVELAKYEPEVDADVKAGYKAFISYYIVKSIPEDIRDQFALQGISFTCANCPHCTRFTNKDGEIDRRKKKAMCKYAEFGTCFIDGDACDQFYEWVADGKIEPVEVSDAVED